jgi:hypothetical protein
MESRGEEPLEPTSEDESSPLLTGFWLGFWSLLLLIIGSWFVHVPLIGQRETRKADGRVSFFREAPQDSAPNRDIAGRKTR